MTKITFSISNTLNISGGEQQFLDEITSSLTIDNPKYVEAKRHGRYPGNIKSKLHFFEMSEDGLKVPRGAAKIAHGIASRHGDVEIIDSRLTLPEIDLTFAGTLRPYQEQAVTGILNKEFGVLEAGTGSGKTIMALAVIAERKQPTIILVHTKELLFQWQDRIKDFLGVDAGLVGGGNFDIRPVTVAIVNSARKYQNELSQCFGHLIVDECHRVPSTLFTETVEAFSAKYMLGLSATPYRRDGLDKLIGWYLGMHRVGVNMGELKRVGAVLSPKIIKKSTDFRYWYDDDYSQMISALINDLARNTLVAHDINTQAEAGGLSLVVSDRVEHLETLAGMMTGDHHVLTGKTPQKKRQEIVQSLANGDVHVLFSTLSLIGEGFDCPSMDALFLTTPIKFSGRLKQVVGRVLRPADGKIPQVYDYQDCNVGILKHQAKSRERVYATL